MSESIIKIVIVFFFSLSLLGWGRLFFKIIGGKYDDMPFYTMAIGMAVVIFLGGFLNMVKLAFPVSLHIITAVGIISSALYGVLTIRVENLKKDITLTTIIITINYIVVFAILLFYLSTLVPSSTFNIGDDYKKYIPRIVRMLQTGTLGGNPFGSIGLDTLGAQAFLNAFVLNISKFETLAVFDAVFCFFLSMLVFFDIRKSFMMNESFLIVLIFLFVLINPQSVNISSLYSGTLMILALIISFSELSKTIDNQNTELKLHHIACASITAAALVSLKFTFLPFLLAYISIHFLFVIKKGHLNKIKWTHIFVPFISLLILFVSPWLLTHNKNFLIALFHKPQSPPLLPNDSAILYSTSFSDIKNNILDCFSTSQCLYGGTGLSYTLCIIVMLFFAFHLIIKNNKKESDNTYFSLCSVCLACISVYLLYPFVFPTLWSIRFTVPAIAAIFPLVTVILLEKNLYFFTRKYYHKKLLFVLVCALLPFVFIIFDFSVVLYKRVSRMYFHHTFLAFPSGSYDHLKLYNESIFSEKSKNYYHYIQNLTEKNTTILAWISASFHIDHARNEIFSIGMPLELKAPWINIPVGTDAKTFKKVLIEKQIQYVMWEYNKSGMTSRDEFHEWTLSPHATTRATGQIGLFLYKTLKNIADDSNLLYDNGYIMLFQITE